MDEFQECQNKKKKKKVSEQVKDQQKKNYIVYDSFYLIAQKGKPIAIESRLVVVRSSV